MWSFCDDCVFIILNGDLFIYLCDRQGSGACPQPCGTVEYTFGVAWQRNEGEEGEMT